MPKESWWWTFNQLINISDCCLTSTGNKGSIEAGRWGGPPISIQPSSKHDDLAQILFHLVSLHIHSCSFLVKIESHGNGGGLNAEVNSQQRCPSLVACAPKAFYTRAIREGMQWPGKEKEKQQDLLRNGTGIPGQILNSWGKSVISWKLHFTPAPWNPK
jgi:hypothetical protein